MIAATLKKDDLYENNWKYVINNSLFIARCDWNLTSVECMSNHICSFSCVLVQAKQLSAREADLQKQDAFYREQVARLEERVSLHLEHDSAGHINV